MGPPCNKLLPPSPPLPCSRNDAKLSVISRVFALPMESASSSSSSRSLDDGEKERRREGKGRVSEAAGADADIDLFLAITRTICFLV